MPDRTTYLRATFTAEISSFQQPNVPLPRDGVLIGDVILCWSSVLAQLRLVESMSRIRKYIVIG